MTANLEQLSVEECPDDVVTKKIWQLLALGQHGCGSQSHANQGNFVKSLPLAPPACSVLTSVFQLVGSRVSQQLESGFPHTQRPSNANPDVTTRSSFSKALLLPAAIPWTTAIAEQGHGSTATVAKAHPGFTHQATCMRGLLHRSRALFAQQGPQRQGCHSAGTGASDKAIWSHHRQACLHSRAVWDDPGRPRARSAHGPVIAPKGHGRAFAAVLPTSTRPATSIQ